MSSALRIARLHANAWLSTLGVSLALAQVPTVSSVVNDATREARLCPGARALVNGQMMMGAGGPMGSTVTVGGRTAPVLGSTVEGALVVQIPAELPPGPAPLVVAHGGMQSASFSVNLAAFAPSLYDELRLDSGFRGTSTVPLLVAPGEIVQATALCLGPTLPAFPTNSNQRFPLAISPLVTVDSAPAEVLEAFHAGQGAYVVRFRVPANLSDGRARLTVQAGGQLSNAREVPISTRPIIRRVFNAALLEETFVSPGAIASIRVENIGQKDQLSGFPATSLEGISVTWNGIPAPIYHLVASAKQINVQVPFEIPAASVATVQVRSARGEGNTWPAVVDVLSPGFFRVAGEPPLHRNVAVLFANTAWRVMPRSLAEKLGLPSSCRNLAPSASCGQPAAPGDYIQLYVNGLGPAAPDGNPAATPIGTGEIPPLDGNPLYQTLQVPRVAIGEIPVEVLYSGLVPGIAGLYQINVRIPENAPTGDAVPVGVGVVFGDRGHADYGTIAIAPR